MIGSLWAGISGLNANSSALTLIGDNIANVNTIGFKSNSVLFANVLSQSLAGAEGNDIGRGVKFVDTVPHWSQGTLKSTSNPTDLAIKGKGFFMLRDTDNSIYYSRAGAFTFDNIGDLKDPGGLLVQGYQVNTDGSLGNMMDINVSGKSTMPPGATDNFAIDLNLDSGASVGDTYSSTLSVYDSLGNSIPTTFTFTNTNSGEWSIAASIPATFGTGASVTPAALEFDTDGQLTAPLADATLSLTLTNGAATPQDITWDLYDANGTNRGDITGYSSPSTTTFQTQNGYPSGVLRSVSVDEDGFVIGAYSNGENIPLYQIALADFPSYYGLTRMGDNLYAESRASGQAMPGVPKNGTLGIISSSSLEMSNVDLASEFVKMITTQRAFQASSRVITTSDEVLSELINLKR